MIRRWLIVLSVLAGCTTVPATTGNTLQGEDGQGDNTDSQTGNARGDEADDGDVDADDDESVSSADGADPEVGGDVGDPDDPVLGGDDCAAEAAAAQAVLDVQCVSCHGNGANDGGFSGADDLDLVVQRGFVRLGSLGGSEVFQVVESGEMPLGAPNLGQADLDALEAWILCVPDDGEYPPAGGGGNVGGGDDGDDDEEVDEDDDDDDDDDDIDEDADEVADEDAEEVDESAEDDDDD
jgi:mono/diheme cytochrome c family protein